MLHFNRAALEMYGYSRSDVLWVREADLYAEPHKPGPSAIDGIQFKGTQLHKKKDGSSFPVTLTSGYFVWGSNEVRLMAVHDITEGNNNRKELRRSREELRSLSACIISAREEERRSIAREIHDELGQTLTALKMDLDWLTGELPEGHNTILERIEAMNSLVKEAIRAMKRVVTKLRPGVLDDLGIAAALEWQAGEFQKRTGVICHLQLEPEDISISSEVATAVFRIFQESLTNIIRHAHATTVSTTFRRENDCLVLRIKDNGTGISTEQITSSTSFGLTGMRERAYIIGGELDIKQVRSGGTEVYLRVPLGDRGVS